MAKSKPGGFFDEVEEGSKRKRVAPQMLLPTITGPATQGGKAYAEGRVKQQMLDRMDCVSSVRLVIPQPAPPPAPIVVEADNDESVLAPEVKCPICRGGMDSKNPGMLPDGGECCACGEIKDCLLIPCIAACKPGNSKKNSLDGVATPGPQFHHGMCEGCLKKYVRASIGPA